MASAAITPRKRPTQARSTRTVDAIVEAAARILETEGIDGYTTNAVAERAGVSVGSLYQYFPGKDALTAALIVRETAVLVQDLADVERIADGWSALEALISACVAHQMRRPALARLLDFEEQRLPLELHARRMSSVALSAVLSILQKIGKGYMPDPHTAACDVLAIVKAIVDGAGERGESDPTGLHIRLKRAVFGYLSVTV